MRVRCIDNADLEEILTEGKSYEVERFGMTDDKGDYLQCFPKRFLLEEDKVKFEKGDYVESKAQGYIVKVERADRFNFGGVVVKSDFEPRKVGERCDIYGYEFFKKIDYKEEDKMEQVKIKVGDKVRTKKEITIIGVRVEFVVKRIFVDEENGDRFLVPDNTTPIQYISENDVELVTRRTVEEIKNEIIEITKDRHCTKTYKYLVMKHDTECSAENYYYWKDCYREVPFGKACWLTEEESRNYSKELNEIIGVDKK